MGNLGLSYFGTMYMIMILVPNIKWSKNKPSNYNPQDENPILLFLERSGQILCTITVVCFSNTNPQKIDLWLIWLVLSLVLMLLYEGFWLRYFRGQHTMSDFYRPYLGFPYPGASLPVTAFLFLGIYGKLWALIIASIILAIGHIGIHIHHYRKLTIINERK